MPLVSLGSFDVSAAAVAAAPDDLALGIARCLTGSPAARDAATIETVSPELARRVTTERGLCGAVAVLALGRLLELKGAGPRLRDEVRRILMREDPAIAWETYASPRFDITFDATAVIANPSGPEVMEPGACPPRLLKTLEPGPVPLYVQRLAFWLERAYDVYRSATFALLPPRSGGRVPVKTFAVGDAYGWATRNFGIVLDSALGPDLLCSVAIHELFHMFQYEYGVTPAAPWYTSLLEGGAVFAEDALADGVNRYLHEAGPSRLNGPGVLAEPGTPITPGGQSEYKSALFWRYVCEQAARGTAAPPVGPRGASGAFPDATAYRDLMARCFTGVPLEEALRPLFPGRQLVEFRYADLRAGEVVTSSETVFGNYALGCYVKELPRAGDARFTFVERDERLAFAPLVPGEPPQDRVATVKRRSAHLRPDSPWLAFEDQVNGFAHQFFEVTVDRAVPAVDVVFRAGASLPRPLLQIAVVDDDGRLRDVHRSDRRTARKRIAAGPSTRRASRLAIVVSSPARGDFALWIAPAPAAPDVMATGWNCGPGTEYEADPAEAAWTWRSPDLWVSVGSARPDLRAREDNRLALRLRNRGARRAAHVRVDFSYRQVTLDPLAGPVLAGETWRPVENQAAFPQALTEIVIEPYSTTEGEITWWPGEDLAGRIVCVRGEVLAPDDVNTDNKVVLSLLRCLPPAR